MNFLKKIYHLILVLIKSLLIVGVLFIFSYVYFYFFPLGNYMAKEFNQKNIQSIKLGMTEQEVKNILGTDCIEFFQGKEYFERNKNYDTKSYLQLKYAEPGVFDSGAEAVVGLTNGKVTRVHVVILNTPIYLCLEDRCPKIMDIDMFNRYVPKN